MPLDFPSKSHVWSYLDVENANFSVNFLNSAWSSLEQTRILPVLLYAVFFLYLVLTFAVIPDVQRSAHLLHRQSKSLQYSYFLHCSLDSEWMPLDCPSFCPPFLVSWIRNTLIWCWKNLCCYKCIVYPHQMYIVEPSVSRRALACDPSRRGLLRTKW